jgi:hypothetical protein
MTRTNINPIIGRLVLSLPQRSVGPFLRLDQGQTKTSSDRLGRPDDDGWSAGEGISPVAVSRCRRRGTMPTEAAIESGTLSPRLGVMLTVAPGPSVYEMPGLGRRAQGRTGAEPQPGHCSGWAIVGPPREVTPIMGSPVASASGPPTRVVLIRASLRLARRARASPRRRTPACSPGRAARGRRRARPRRGCLCRGCGRARPRRPSARPDS